jgi:hypothetical protein
MRLAIDRAGYDTAADAFASANQVAAVQYVSLVGRLDSYAAMAGDDSTSTEFAAAYDEAATEAVAAFAAVVPAFANLGRLTQRSGANHHAANANSIIAGAVVYDGWSLPAGDYVSVLPATPPSSLGGDTPSLPAQVSWILDHVQGFVWPNADTDRLRGAAHAWRTAAEGVGGLAAQCVDAAAALWTQRSPEIPVAVAATEDLRTTLREVSAQFATLATACDDYAAQVDQKHEEIRALVDEILAMIVEGIVISAAIGLITGGAGAVAGGSAVVAKVAAQSPRFAALLAALRSVAAASSAYLRTARASLRASRVKLGKFADARLAMRSEAGQMSWSRKSTGWLGRHEHSRSHTLETHVGKSDATLIQRMRDNPEITGSSSFTDRETAERAIGQLLDERRSSLDEWLAGRKPRLRLEGHLDSIVGRWAGTTGEVRDASGVRVILVRDHGMPDGFRILTAFPRPK